MPDPHPDAYQRYREGVLTLHVLCSGRYLESLWLREFGLEDPPEYRRHERIAEIPEIVGDWGDERDFYVVEARSDDGPCLFASSDRLYLVWSGRGARHRLQWTSSTDGIDWDPKSTIDGQRSEHVPGFVHFKGRWYIAWTGTDSHHHLNVMSTTNGTDWGGKHTFRSNPQAHSNDGPRLVVVNSVMYLVWAGRGSNR